MTINCLTISSQYNPNDIDIGIVHIGLGAFHRAHQAVYIEKLLNLDARYHQWGICSVNIRSNKAIVDDLKKANYQYHVAEYQDSKQVTLRQINAIRETLFAGKNGNDNDILFQRLSEKTTKLVTLTVTEKAYCINPATGQLNEDDDGIQHDIQRPSEPITAIGILVEGLRLRQLNKVPAFTVLSCDNMPSNGKRLRLAVIELAKKNSKELAMWIEENVSFPCSMVDRIVPAMNNENALQINNALNVNDSLILQTETFSQWVVEKDTNNNCPPWDKIGVIETTDVSVFEDMKLRMLNGSHSLLAYLGSLAGYHTVGEAIQSDVMVSFIKRYLKNEAGITLDYLEGIRLDDYSEKILLRFANDSLHHQLSQIASDGSQKIPQRWLNHCQILMDNNQYFECTALGVAAWIHFIENAVNLNQSINDPLAKELRAIIEQHSQNKTLDNDLTASSLSLITAFLNINSLFSQRLAHDEGFIKTLLDAYLLLSQEGALKTMEAVVNKNRII